MLKLRALLHQMMESTVLTVASSAREGGIMRGEQQGVSSVHPTQAQQRTDLFRRKGLLAPLPSDHDRTISTRTHWRIVTDLQQESLELSQDLTGK